ncbi:MAG TPA: DUF3298 domain-containing protein [Pyrinomonadaceae bacterium]|nr:DUF3298 domain-containing protein [Pyrinomonadaceae bacterium]
MNVVLSSAQGSVGTRFKGSIAQARFEMVLRREDGELRGSYYYEKSGSANRLSLRGKIGADGSFTMQEFDSSGRQTGEFKGTWKDDANESGASLEGEWKKPGGAEGQSFFASEQTVFFNNGTEINDRQTAEHVKARRLDLTAEYPELTGGANAAAFNQLVRSNVGSALADFKKQMMYISAEDLRMLPEGINNYIDVGYNVEYADDDLISVSFVESTFAGGAHPNYNFFTITYDLKGGRELKLSDLFKPGAKYIEAVAAYATRDLQSRKDPDGGENMGLAQDVFADGAKPLAENYARWNITKKGLMFTFDPYQVGPYAYGSQSVIIPYARLKEIARPGGALARMLK